MTIQQLLERHHEGLTEITNDILSLIKKDNYIKSGEYDITKFIPNTKYDYKIKLIRTEGETKGQFVPYMLGGGILKIYNIDTINNNYKTKPEAMEEMLISLLNHEITHLLDYDKLQRRVNGVVRSNGNNIDAFELNAYIHSAIEYAKKYKIKVRNRHELCKLLFVSQPGTTSIALDVENDKKLLARVYRRFSEAGIIADNYDVSKLTDENGKYPEDVKERSFKMKYPRGEIKF